MKIFASATIASFAIVPPSFAATAEQILEFRLERIPQGLKDPARAVLFPSSMDSATEEELAARDKSEYFDKIHSNPNNVAVGYIHNGTLATSIKYQATDSTPFFVYSVTKFVVGFLSADQVCEGNIDVGKTMGALSSELDSTAYKAIAFKHVLDMSSGVFANAQKQTVPSYQEITRKGISMMDQLSAPKKPNSEPGAKFDYSNYDSNALTFAIKGATGKTVAELFETVIWQNITSSHNGFWLTDSSGLPVGAFGLALSASDLLKVGSIIANRVHSDECLTDYYSGDGIVAGGDKDGLANWRKHSWVNPKNLNQFGGMGYGGQVLMFDTKTGAVVFIYSNYNDKYDDKIFAVGWKLLNDLK